MINIIIFSDSVGTGQYVSLCDSWASLISKSSSKDFAENIVVTNASGNGRTTRQALEVMQYEVLSKSPDILLIQFGLNDSNIWDDANGMPRVSEEAFKANLLEMIDRALLAKVSEIFLITNHTIDMMGYIYNRRIRGAISRSRKVHLLDVEKVFDNECPSMDHSYLLLEDGVHINKEGHKLYFNIIYPNLKNAIQGIIDANGRT